MIDYLFKSHLVNLGIPPLQCIHLILRIQLRGLYIMNHVDEHLVQFVIPTRHKVLAHLVTCLVHMQVCCAH
jgi:hypothetical protein